jgi:hypothetical protein
LLKIFLPTVVIPVSANLFNMLDIVNSFIVGIGYTPEGVSQPL